MQVAATQARITQRDTFFKAVDPDSGLGLRVLPGRKPQLDRLAVCTHFISRDQADQVIAKLFGASTLEVIRFDR